MSMYLHLYVMCIDTCMWCTYTHNLHMYTSQDLVLKLTHSDPMLPSWGPDKGDGAATWVRRRQKHLFPPKKKLFGKSISTHTQIIQTALSYVLSTSDPKE